MRYCLVLLPLFLNLNFRFSSKENLLICSVINQNSQQVFFKDIFDYYRYDNVAYFEESFVTLVVGTPDRNVRFVEDTIFLNEQRLKLQKGMPAMTKHIFLDRHSKVYYDKASPVNYINSDCCLHFTNKEAVSKFAVPIPLAPADSFQFFIPVDKRLWQASSYDFPKEFKVGQDSLFFFMVADIPVSIKKTHKAKYYKNQVVVSDTIWFVPK